VLANRAAELQGLMAKADTGVAGPVVAETGLSQRVHRGARPDPAGRRGLAAQQVQRDRAAHARCRAGRGRRAASG